MALFTDGLPANIEFLRSFESGILEVAETEGIDLDAKLALAAEEAADVILRFLLSAGTPGVQQQRQLLGVSDVVVTPAIRRWHALRTLEHVFRDAYGHQLNERYAQKLKEYQTAVRVSESDLFARGVGLVLQPVPKPPVPNPSSGGVNSQSLYVAVSWTGSQGEEGAASEILLTNLGNGASIPGPIALGWTGGWNVYAGATVDTLILQTASPIDSGTSWLSDGVLNIEGHGPSSGQAPDYFVVDYHGLRRG